MTELGLLHVLLHQAASGAVLLVVLHGRGQTASNLEPFGQAVAPGFHRIHSRPTGRSTEPWV